MSVGGVSWVVAGALVCKACKDCNFNIARELLQFIRGFVGTTKNYVNKRNKKGETSLHYSAMISKSALHYPGEDKLIVTMLMERSSLTI